MHSKTFFLSTYVFLFSIYIVHYIKVLYVNLMYNQINLLFKIVNPQEDLCLCILYKVPIAKKELENYPEQTESSSFDLLYNIHISQFSRWNRLSNIHKQLQNIPSKHTLHSLSTFSISFSNHIPVHGKLHLIFRHATRNHLPRIK